MILIHVLVLFLSACSINATTDEEYRYILSPKPWHDLKVKFDTNVDGFYKLPRFTEDSLMDNYVRATPEPTFNLPITFYCYPDDPRACVMFDQKGDIAGFQVSFVKKDLESVGKPYYNYEKVTNFIKTNFFGIPAYSFRVYFTNPETLTARGANNIEFTAQGIWVYLDGKLIQIPTEEPDEDSDGSNGFYKQGCVPFMGTHYFYKLAELTTCNQLFPFFALYEHKKLIGFGLTAVGKGKTKVRSWYEYPLKEALPYMALNRPVCMDNLHEMYGMTSMHVYLVKDPRKITCLKSPIVE